MATFEVALVNSVKYKLVALFRVILDFNDSIISPKLISSKFISYDPSSLKLQSKLETFPIKPS